MTEQPWARKTILTVTDDFSGYTKDIPATINVYLTATATKPVATATLKVIDMPFNLVFFKTDHLGTPRVITDQDGTVLSIHDYLAYGEELTDPEFTTNRMKFTGHERDPETGLDYMLARYYTSGSGRFLQVDPGYDYDSMDPMSWNLYAYVRENPVRYMDVSGLTLKEAIALYNHFVKAQLKGIPFKYGSVEYEFSIGKRFNHKDGYWMTFPHNIHVGWSDHAIYDSSFGDILQFHTHPNYSGERAGSTFSPQDIDVFINVGYKMNNVRNHFVATENMIYVSEIQMGAKLDGFDAKKFKKDYDDTLRALSGNKKMTFQEKTEKALVKALGAQGLNTDIKIYAYNRETGQWRCLN